MQKRFEQHSKLLPFLFKHIDEGELVTVFHVGPAQPETVNFFSNYRCKLYFMDLFSTLPTLYDEDSTSSPEQQLEQVITFPPGTRFDVCLFWDLFNYLNSDAIGALLTAIRPHLTASTVAHAFSVHNLRTAQNAQVYGIQQLDILSLRPRCAVPEGYAPHSQNQLKQLLHCFKLQRSVLLADSRLELLLQARL